MHGIDKRSSADEVVEGNGGAGEGGNVHTEHLVARLARHGLDELLVLNVGQQVEDLLYRMCEWGCSYGLHITTWYKQCNSTTPNP